MKLNVLLIFLALAGPSLADQFTAECRKVMESVPAEYMMTGGLTLTVEVEDEHGNRVAQSLGPTGLKESYGSKANMSYVELSTSIWHYTFFKKF